MAQLALDDDERHALVRHLDRVGVSELVRREAAPHAGRSGCVAKLGARGGGRPAPASRRADDDAEERPDWQLDACGEPWL